MPSVLLSWNTQKAHVGERAPQLRNYGTRDGPDSQWGEADTKTQLNYKRNRRKQR
jgi:hypothetical protein